MRAIKVDTSNHNFGPPPGQEETIVDLPCQIVEEEGDKIVRAHFELTDEEREMIAQGYNLNLDVHWIGAYPPVRLWVAPAQEEVA